MRIVNDCSIVQDTNILISALLSPQSKPYPCVDLARTRNIKSFTCKEILEELKSKLIGKLKNLALDSEAVVQIVFVLVENFGTLAISRQS